MRRPTDDYCDSLYSTAYTERLCPDVVLRAFGKAYPAHRVILASQSAYFATLLRWVSWQPAAGAGQGAAAGAEWPGLPCHELVLGEDVTQSGFEWILEYFYASPHVAVTSDNAFDVLATAHYLGVTAVQTACVEFLAQHLDPHNLAACLQWATRADHGEASDLLVASCRRLLALRLPRNLAAWAPALVHIEPRTLLDIMSSDHLAVPTEYDRYELVKEVAKICASAAASASAAWGDAEEDAADGDGGGGGAAATTAAAAAAAGTLEVRRMLSSALRLSDEGLAGHLPLAGSRASSAGVPSPAGGGSLLASVAGSSDAGPASGASCRAFAMGTSPSPSASEASACADGGGSSSGSSALTSSQASSRSTVRLCEPGGGSAAAAAAEERGGEDGGAASSSGAAAASPSSPRQRPASDDGAVTGGPGPGSPADAAAAAAAAGAAACSRLLLHGAVRYEHLTVPQLMAIEAEGLVESEVLHSALWQRTRLDCRIHARGTAARPRSQASTSADGTAAEVAAAAPAPALSRSPTMGAAAPGTVDARLGPEPQPGRAFRVCWRLAAGALKKLQPRDMLQSEPHQHAGALWQLRLCRSDRSRGHLGLFVGRHLATSSAAAAAAAAAGCAAAAGQQPGGGPRVVSPARQLEVAAARPAAPGRPASRAPGTAAATARPSSAAAARYAPLVLVHGSRLGAAG
ncbi:hypothetical protein PLESTB_000206200 [Pleodorina starrii]|uniref:BTB domain-containing protein n=1 Tax=Pleodorina starrii TaxID=330485 RepID=A0A9W6EXU6_9CHLO|nr:hypothetical protein PLESTB_000206200 [Pleodorina starrii]